MRIGYACLTTGVRNTDQKTCVMKNATPEKLTELIAHNLGSLDRIMDYNIKNGVRLFRVSSDIIPFGSSPANTLAWDALFEAELSAIGRKALDSGVRLSMHPGQYTVLNSPNPEVVERAVEDLRYHTRILDALGLGPEHKLILHIGGIYGDKVAAMERFANSYKRLDQTIKNRLVIENDDKMYTIKDVLTLGRKLGIPVVFDNLHHRINGVPEDQRTQYQWIELCGETWGGRHGPQKTHYSQQAAGRRPGSHSETICLSEFLSYAEGLPCRALDIMLEVKDKNLSALKCILATRENPKIALLEQEWARYKYTVLERSPANYQKIRVLLKDKAGYPALEFYGLIEEALAAEPETGHARNAVQHVWGYLKGTATEKEKAQVQRGLDQGSKSLNSVKGQLRRLAEKYGSQYLLDSYYFTL